MWKCRHCGETAQRDFKRCRSCQRPRIPRKAQRFSSAGMPTQKLIQPPSSAGMPTQKLDQPLQRAFCMRCQSSKMIPHVRVVDHAHGGGTTNASVEVQQNPRALLFKGGVSSSLYAWVCGDCGYTELYASHPEELWAAYQVAQSNR